MGLIGAMIKGAIAKRVFDAARKPHNQQRAKDMYGRVTGRGGAGRQGPPPQSGRAPR
jgi:hypothetical protein